MTAVPNWLLGRHITTISITPQTVATDGTLTPGTLTSLVGRLDEITNASEPETENIVPLDLRPNNNVIVGDDLTLTLIEILAQSGGNILGTAFYSGTDYASFTLTRASKVFTFIGTMTGYQEAMRRGKNTGQLTMKMAGIEPTLA